MKRDAESVSNTSTIATKSLMRRKTAGDYTPSGKKYGPSGRDKAASTYASLDLVPPGPVRSAAKLGLRLRQRNEQRKDLPKGDPDRLAASASLGGLEIGVQRAVQLASGEPMAPRDIRRMARYFARKASDPQREGFGDKRRPTPAYVSWLLWGGDAGRTWAERMVKRMDRADARGKRGAMIEATRARLDEYNLSWMPGLIGLDPCLAVNRNVPQTAEQKRRAKEDCARRPTHLSTWTLASRKRSGPNYTVKPEY
jgi:hypothetical protein